MQKLAVIIPCYNEQDRLKEAPVFELLENTPGADIYFANDGSKDDTLLLLQKISAKDPQRIFILDYTENEGKARAVYKSLCDIIAKSRYEFIGYLDADFSTPSFEFTRMYQVMLRENKWFIFGSRILTLNSKINRKAYRHVIGRVIVTIINLKFKLGIYDTQCGSKIFSSQLIQQILDRPFIANWMFDVEIFLRLRQKNLLAHGLELPLAEWHDISGSKLNWKDGFRVAKEIKLLFSTY